MKFEDKGYEAYGQGNLQLALEEWTVEADAGNPFAQFSLGMMYENGTGIPQNLPKAIELYQSSAAQGVTHARHNLAWLFIRGDAGQDLVFDGVRLLEENAKAGFGESRSDIGLMYQDGR